MLFFKTNWEEMSHLKIYYKTAICNPLKKAGKMWKNSGAKGKDCLGR